MKAIRWILLLVIFGAWIFLLSPDDTRAQGGTPGGATPACPEEKSFFSYALGDDSGYDIESTVAGAISECDTNANNKLQQLMNACTSYCKDKCVVSRMTAYTVPCALLQCGSGSVGGGATLFGFGATLNPPGLNKCYAWGAAIVK